MNTAEVLTIIGSILIPMFAGFGWIIHQISDIKTRLTVLEMRVSFIERILEKMGMPIPIGRGKITADLKENE